MIDLKAKNWLGELLRR